MALVEAGLEFATEILRPDGAFVAKVLAGGTDAQLLAELKGSFNTVKHAKPPASRAESAETYVINLDRHINRNVVSTDQGIQGASTIQ